MWNTIGYLWRDNISSLDEIPPKKQGHLSSYEIGSIIELVTDSVGSLLAVSNNQILIQQWETKQLIVKDSAHYQKSEVQSNEVQSNWWMVQVESSGGKFTLRTLQAYNEIARGTSNYVFDILTFFWRTHNFDKSLQEKYQEAAIAA